MEQHHLRELNRVQTVSYPVIRAKQNIVVVSPHRSGKTAGYVAPLASSLLDANYYKKVPRGYGPKVLVFAPYCKKVEQAANMFRELTKDVRITHAHGGGAEQEKQEELLRGVDVLVTTPMCFLRVINKWTNLKRLCHLVLDDTDILFDKFQTEIQQILELVAKLSKERNSMKPKVDVTIQVVITSKKWTAGVEALVSLLEDPVVCITDHVESCIYSGIKPQVSCLSNQKKIEKLVGILKEIAGHKRAVVLCKDETEVKYVTKVLTDVGISNVLPAHEGDTGLHVTEVSDMWKKEISVKQIWEESSTKLPIMVRSDEVLEEIVVNNAEVLIHYNLSKSYKTFGLRFACILDHFRNIFKKDDPIKKCSVYIFMDEDFQRQLGLTMKFVERTGTAVPEFVKQLVQEAERKNEAEKLNEPFCEDMKMFGKCWDIKRCPNRHILSSELDIPHEHIPTSGSVKILIQHMHNACHFSARLLAQETQEGVWQPCPLPAVTGQRLDVYFGRKQNRRAYGTPEVGDILAVGSYQYDEFHRAVVLKITKYCDRKQPELVNLRLIDNGRFEDNVHVMRLYCLPEELRLPLPAVVDCYLTNLMPKDLDTVWSSTLTEWLRRRIHDATRDSPKAYVVGKIVLSLDRSLWLDPVECMDFLQINNATLVKFSLREDMLKQKLAVKNLDHIPNLRKQCIMAGIEIAKEEKTKTPTKPSQPKPEWAWLPQDVLENVYITAVGAPDIIFLRLIRFNESLEQLTKEMQTTVVEVQEQVRLLDVGDVCLAKYSEGDEWNRAMISQKISDEEIELFFVDFGDFVTVSWNEVALIPNRLITKLPFQAIECSLAGIQFIKGEESSWEEIVIDVIADLSRNSDNEAISLQVKVCGVESVGKISKGKRYKVVLSDGDEVFNKKLVSSEYVEFAEGDNHFFDANTSGIEDCGSSSGYDGPKRSLSSDVKVITTIQKEDKCEVLDELNINTMVAADEKEQRVIDFLKTIREGDFEHSHMEEIREEFNRLEYGESSDNDADISEDENYSNGSVKSLPQSRGCLPKSTGTPPNVVLENSFSELSSSVTSLESSRKGSCMSLNEDQDTSNRVMMDKEHQENSLCEPSTIKSNSSTLPQSEPKPSLCTLSTSQKSPQPVNETGIVLSDEYIKSSPNTTQETKKADNSVSLVSSCSPFIHSTPVLEQCSRPFENTLTPLVLPPTTPSIDQQAHSSLSSPSSSCSRVSGVGARFKDMVSPIFYGSHSSNSISPRPQFAEKTMPIYEHVSKSNKSPTVNDIRENNAVGFEIDEVKENKTQMTIRDHTLLPESNLSSKNMRWVEQKLLLSSDEEQISNVIEDQRESTQGTSHKENDLVYKHPLVYWHENENYVWIHIKLSALTRSQYIFTCDATSFDFRTVNFTPYAVKLVLFSPHIVENVTHSPKAFHVEIRLEKVLKGKRYFWNRLTQSNEKLHWLKFNAEKGFENLDDSEDEDVKRYALTLPSGNDNPTDSESCASSEVSETMDCDEFM